MKRVCFHIVFFSAWACSPFPAFSMVDPATPTGAVPANGDASWTLDFSDEFNGISLDTTKWEIDVSSSSRSSRPERGINDWWWKSQNVYVDGTGNLVLDVVKHDNNTMYCGSVSSDGRYETQYGYIEARIQVADSTKDTHTAFWFFGGLMGGSTDGTAYDGAEVDIFETAWFGDYTKSVVHVDGYGSYHKARTLQWDAPGIHSGYHTFGAEWNKHVINIYYDGVLRTQYEGTWVLQTNVWLWLSDGASFGNIGTFTNAPAGLLTSAKVDYARVWKPSGAPTMIVVGGNKMNGNFNADPGADKTFAKTAGWYNLAGTQSGSGIDDGRVSTSDFAYDSSQNARISAGLGKDHGLNTGYEIVEGDVFDVGYVWRDHTGWQDATDQIRVRLFTTADDTLLGTPTYLASAVSGTSTSNNTYEAVDHDGIYTATAADAGKILCVAIDGNDSGSGGEARLDNFGLIRHSAAPPPFSLRASYASGNFQVHFPTQNGTDYQVMYKNSLTNDTWIPIETVVGNGNTNTASYPATNTTIFVKVVSP